MIKGAVLIALCTGGAILVLATLGLILIGIIKTVKNGGISSKARNEEARMIQDIYQGLSRMEERVEALETILIERSKDRG